MKTKIIGFEREYALFSNRSNVYFVYDHTTGNVPALVRSSKPSPVGRGEYLAGRPLANTPCRRLFGHFLSYFTFSRQPVVAMFLFVQLCNAERYFKMAAIQKFAFRMSGVG